MVMTIESEPDFTLTVLERNSPLWAKIKAHLDEALQRQRERNDRDAPEFATAKIRGHIECLKALRSIGDEPPQTDG